MPPGVKGPAHSPQASGSSRGALPRFVTTGAAAAGTICMKIVLRSNDPVEISFVQALLADVGVQAVVLDQHMSVLEGSIGAIPRRLVVVDEDFAAAGRVLREAGLPPPAEGWGS